MHRDNGNLGPSFIKAFGDFSGGCLEYWPEDAGGDLMQVPQKEKMPFDLNKGLALFNGNCAHQVSDFKGTRFSVVYFTVGCHARMTAEDRAKMSSLGIPVPAVDVDPYALLRAPTGYGSARKVATPQQVSKGEPPAYRFFENSVLERRAGQLKPRSEEEVKNIAARRLQPENAKCFYSNEQRRMLMYGTTEKPGDAEMED